jgi:fermentation-respiration switch protein FrsA (DUF1100 family)
MFTSSIVPRSKFLSANLLRPSQILRKFTLALLFLSGIGLAYEALSVYVAKRLAYAPHVVPEKTPESVDLPFQNVTFTSRDENPIHLRGWFIPGILPNGEWTTRQTIIVVHGMRTNLEDKEAGVLELCAAFALHGFAVLTFDMRGTGDSDPAPLTLGYFEQNDVLGAVDFLLSGPLPYPDLGRPRTIGGWGLSMGGATLLLAASQEPAIQAVVSDSAYADLIPLLEREMPKKSHLPPFFTYGAILAAKMLYGVDFYHVRPVDVVTKIAPRPIFFIHGSNDRFIPAHNMDELLVAAEMMPDARVQAWSVPGVEHAQAFLTTRNTYVSRVIEFFTIGLDLDDKII